MNKEQLVEIKLSEYLEFEELKKHGKLVKITTITRRENCEFVAVGESVEYVSDGKCWMTLASKLSTAGELIAEKVKEIDALKRTIEEFEQTWKKKSRFELWLNS